jgi:hypothetical protein
MTPLIDSHSMTRVLSTINDTLVSHLFILCARVGVDPRGSSLLVTTRQVSDEARDGYRRLGLSLSRYVAWTKP